MGFVYIISHFIKGGDLNLNVLNMIFLFLGILLHKKSVLYIKAINIALQVCYRNFLLAFQILTLSLFLFFGVQVL